MQSNEQTEYLDLKYFAPYNRELGFKIAVDGFHNTPHAIPYGSIMSLNPPGAIYDPDVEGPYKGVSINDKINNLCYR